ncbi:hypothetical protein CC1G_11176 [Coprinopsis cinerea okayama7|uniref:Uncharacterized protein n=1 Tax=Coprinopsis cinerea (strain Okayama-7 / 130 / ATCC MYA-4618 / FGSC 9003) TaxID=240176 RepID=A8P4E1_COPC7|nr:hypothetical protein CC1G_11176 [Coprinopsis cinerea okayama7\|eukprot:XP_001838733.1 hypothetical protein CC1G_11176 [Coprinopsis cinerea okayama7\
MNLEGMGYYLAWDALWNAAASTTARLTHLAMSVQNLSLVVGVLRRAPNLRYLALFGGDEEDLREWLEQVDTIKFSRLVKRLSYERLGEGFRRFVVLDKGRIADEDLVDSGEQAQFWWRVEELIDAGFCSDVGDRWEENELGNFRVVGGELSAL